MWIREVRLAGQYLDEERLHRADLWWYQQNNRTWSYFDEKIANRMLDVIRSLVSKGYPPKRYMYLKSSF